MEVVSTSTFFVVRIFVLSLGNLLSTPDKDARKFEIFVKHFFKNDDFSVDQTLMKLRAVKRKGTVITGKLAKLKATDIHRPTPTDIKPEVHESWPPAHFIVDVTEQAMVIEMKSLWGMTKKRICDVLSERATSLLAQEGYAVRFEVIVPKEAFWRLIGQADGVFSIAFKLNSPNLFGASKALNQELEELSPV